jgi:hypothetical protein
VIEERIMCVKKTTKMLIEKENVVGDS